VQVTSPAWTLAAHYFKYHLKKRLDNGQRFNFKVKFTKLKLFLMDSETAYQHSSGFGEGFRGRQNQQPFGYVCG
jgi:hypothetical protein